jgi:hypothetical protein
MSRPSKPDRPGRDLTRLIEGLRLAGEPLTRHQVVTRVFRNHITADRLDHALEVGRSRGLIEVAELPVSYQITRVRTVISLVKSP